MFSGDGEEDAFLWCFLFSFFVCFAMSFFLDCFEFEDEDELEEDDDDDDDDDDEEEEDDDDDDDEDDEEDDDDDDMDRLRLIFSWTGMVDVVDMTVGCGMSFFWCNNCDRDGLLK